MKKAVSAGIFLILAAVLFLPAPAGAIELKFKLYGGYGYLFGGDLNAGTEGRINLYRYLLSSQGYPISGSFKPTHLGVHAGGEVILMFNSLVGIGVGADTLEASRANTITATDGVWPFRFTTRAEASAVPIKFTLHLCLPAGKGFRMNVHFGAGYYLARMANSLRAEDPTSFTEYDNSARAKARTIGLHAGLGFEFDIIRPVSIFLEAQARYAPLGEFRGDSHFATPYDTVWMSGPLYYYEEQGPESLYYPMMIVLDAPPAASPFVRNVREAKIDFSGGTIAAGVMIRL
jgi:hypothetical protein